MLTIDLVEGERCLVREHGGGCGRCGIWRATVGREISELAARRSASKPVRCGAQLCEQQNTLVTLRALRPRAKLKRLPG
ncbi:unnamed protein product [Colias eurytheme]|nr:unnamed protein product [Colias eurytheme]